MKNVERILKGFANKRRIAIVQYLKRQKEASVGEIAGAIRLSFKSTSRHLSVLIAAGILEREQRGLLMWYSLASDMPPITKNVISFL